METIKDRAIYVYLSSIEIAERWKKQANRQGTSVVQVRLGAREELLREELPTIHPVAVRVL